MNCMVNTKRSHSLNQICIKAKVRPTQNATKRRGREFEEYINYYNALRQLRY